MSNSVLVRYGVIREVAKFRHQLGEFIERGVQVVVQSHRGIELGTLLEPIAPVEGNNGSHGRVSVDEPVNGEESQVLRRASDSDESSQLQLRAECERQFESWRGWIADWNLKLELIDLEWTLDRAKLILYVLNERGPECTKLALAAAAAGLGIIEVQPVTADGLMRIDSDAGESGCGSGGCGCSPH